MAILIGVAACVWVEAAAGEPVARQYWPTAEWKTAPPQRHGIDPDRLAAAERFVSDPAHATDALVVVRHGYVVGEWCYNAFGRDSLHDSTSMAKSFTSAAVGIAVGEGKIKGPTQRVSEFYELRPPATAQAARTPLTMEHLLTMSAGFDLGGPAMLGHMRTMARSKDWPQWVIAHPLVYEPGTRWQYSFAETIVLSGVIKRATGEHVLEYLRKRMLGPIGVRRLEWMHDPVGHTSGGGDLVTTARDYARFGYLYLNQGRWDGKQIVPAEWVKLSSRPSKANPDYGFLWWRRKMPGVPEDAYYAYGGLGQFIVVIPSLDLVVVRLGGGRRAVPPPEYGPGPWFVSYMMFTRFEREEPRPLRAIEKVGSDMSQTFLPEMTRRIVESIAPAPTPATRRASK